MSQNNINTSPYFPTRMFQSVSWYSIEQSIGNHRSWQRYIKTEKPEPQRTQISTVTYVSFVQNSNQIASSVDRNCKFSTLAVLKELAHRAALFSNRSQKTPKCGKNLSDTLDYGLVCPFFVLTTI